MIKGIGTDIVEVSRVEGETARSGPEFLQEVFTPAEIEYCERRRRKYESYAARFAAKEAFLKARGEGIALGLGRFAVPIRPAEPPRLLTTEWDEDEAARWSLHDLDCGAGYRGALAVEGEEPGAVTCYRLARQP